MKRSRLTYFGVVLLCISIGVLVAVVMPAIAQENATAEQADAEGMLEDMLEQGLEIPETPEMLETPVASPSEVDDSPVCETVRLHYMRDIGTLQTLLESIKNTFAPDVSVAAATSPAPLIVLAGPRSQVDDLKRVIAAIDVPQPQVRLDLWAFQISGGDAEAVAGRAQEAQKLAKTVGDLMRGCAAICANWRPVPVPRSSATRKQQSKPSSQRPK